MLLKIGDIIIASEDIVVTYGCVGHFIYKNKEYKLKKLVKGYWFVENTQNILVSRSDRRKGKRDNENAWLTEDDIIKKFDCIKMIRKRKLEKL